MTDNTKATLVSTSGTSMTAAAAPKRCSPAVATTIGHGTGKELAQANYLGRCHANDEKTFVEMIAALLRDDAQRRALAEGGRKANAELYSWPVIIRRLLPLLDPAAHRASA